MALIRVNKRAKIALLERAISQTELARDTGIPRTLLNQILNGRTNPTDKEKAAIASTLKKKVQDIF